MRLGCAAEHLVAALRDDDEVLDSSPAATGHVDTGLDGDDVPGLEPRRRRAREPRRLVDVHPDAVPEAVAEVLAVAGGGDQVARDGVHLARLPARADGRE